MAFVAFNSFQRLTGSNMKPKRTGPDIYTGTVMPLPSSGTTGANRLALNANSTTITGITGSLSFMNGNYVSSSSSDTPGVYAYQMFNNTTGNDYWQCNYGGGSYARDAYSGTPVGTYQGGSLAGQFVTTVVSGQTVSGEWIQIQFPYAFILTGYGWYPRNIASSWIGYQYNIAGSNDGNTWSQVESKTYTSATAPNYTTYPVIPVTSTAFYKYYRLICIRTCDQDNWMGSEWYLYGKNYV